MDLAELENNNREQLVDEDDSTSKELLNPVSIQNIAKDPCSSPTAADEDEADEDESQDDFGDFEEAAPVSIAADDHQASTSQSYHQHQQIFPSFACLSLARLADLAELWQPPADEDDSFKSDCNQPCAIDDEIFRKMDLGSEADDSKLDADMLNFSPMASNLLCGGNQSPPIPMAFFPNPSTPYLGTPIKKSRPKSSVEKEQNMQSSGMPSEMKQNSANNSQENRNYSKTPAPVVDSLMVPPANFDWTSSGLANPLTGKAVKEAATFDCSFLLDGGNKNGTALNSTAILERDLQALGLVSTPAEQR